MKKSATYKYNYYDETGKRRCKTFSAPTLREARLKAAEWEFDHPKDKDSSMTVLEAFAAYLETKEGVLSPATIRGYESIKRSHIENDPIGKIRLSKLTIVDVQKWVNDAYAAGMSPKTLGNHFGLLVSAIKMQDPSIDLSHVTLPQKEKFVGHTPSDDEVKALIEYANKPEKRDLYISILLAAFGPLRRSEACALTDQDIDGNTITINKAVVKAPDGSWITKTTKTIDSTRTIEFPDFVINELKGIKGPLISCNPDQLHHRFRRAIKYSGLPHFRYHDLRHYGASIMHALGVPDVYIRQRGGWSSDYVMKRVYIDALEAEKKKQAGKINRHFARLNSQSEAKSEAKTSISKI